MHIAAEKNFNWHSGRRFQPTASWPLSGADMNRTFSRLAAVFLLVTAACRPEFQLKNLTTDEALYKASVNEYRHSRWNNAVSGFGKLTTDLPARDTLLPRSYWYLASAHERMGEHLLAAQSFSRLVESFPEDSMADDAALESARSYREMSRKPQLDATYAQTAIASYDKLLSLYPNSPLIATAQKEVEELNTWFAIKDFDAGDYYFRRKLYDSGNIFFKGILAKWPDTPTARDAALRLVESYRAMRHTDDASELCAQLRSKYVADQRVRESCGSVHEATASAER